MSKNTRTRILLTAVAALLLVTMAVGGTLAWLADTTDPVNNTFTTSNIDIELDEGDELDLEMVPGKELTKDPVVTVVKGSEACWLFVQMDKSEGFDTYLDYDMASGWTELDATKYPGVFYRTVEDLSNATADKTFDVILNDKVIVSTDITNAKMDELEKNHPTLTITAYAIQQLKFESALAAWTEITTNAPAKYETGAAVAEGTKN